MAVTLVDWVRNHKKRTWEGLSESPNAIELLEKNTNKINWFRLSKNPNGIHLIEKYWDRIDWSNVNSYLERTRNDLHHSTCPMHLLFDLGSYYYLRSNEEEYVSTVKTFYWSRLSSNPGALSFLEKNSSKIHWPNVCMNPNVNAIKS